MDIVQAAAAAVRDDTVIQTEAILAALKEATYARRERPLFDEVIGDTFVVGPIRAHGVDFAHYLLTVVLAQEDVENIVFLGNYVDGAHESLHVLYLVALLIVHSGKRVVPLMGRHEYLYPMRPEKFGSLQKELELRAANDGAEMEDYENVVKDFFNALSVGCIVDSLYFCVAGGPASTYPLTSPLLTDLSAGSTHESFQEFILNEPMDEDEENMSKGNAFVNASYDAYRYTFNAACNFISRNHLASIVVGMEYYIDRPEYDSFAKPNHYKLSVYFPGYTLGRLHPETKLPAVISILSAPKFCDVNWNNACILQISDRRIIIRELTPLAERRLILPGSHANCFSWVQPLMEKAVVSIIHQLVFGELDAPAHDSIAEEEEERDSILVAKVRRMCQLLKKNSLPLPVLPHPSGSKG